MIGLQPFETFQLLAESGDNDRANTLLIASCDAFSFRKNPDDNEIKQFEVLANRLFSTASPSARIKAAKILKNTDNLTPLLEKILIENAGTELGDYLTNAKHISEQSISALLANNNIDNSAIIARRADLTNPVLTKLFQTNSRKIYRSLAKNENIEFKGSFLNAMAKSAKLDYQVANSLADRSDFDSALLTPVFFDLKEAGRLKIITAFSNRNTPTAPLKKIIEQISVANDELTKALMKLYTENRRPEVTNLLSQITGLKDITCAQIAHDISGAALFVVLRAFGCTAYDGLKVIIHATKHDENRSQILASFAKLFKDVSADSMIYMLNAWRGEVNLLELTKPEYISASRARKTTTALEQENTKVKQSNNIHQAIEALERIGAR